MCKYTFMYLHEITLLKKLIGVKCTCQRKTYYLKNIIVAGMMHYRLVDLSMRQVNFGNWFMARNFFWFFLWVLNFVKGQSKPLEII